MSNAHGVARDQLRAFIERIERLEEEKKTVADDIKDVYGEAKAMGYDTKIMKKVIALRKKDEQERTEEEMILDSYLGALGMIPQFEMFEPDEVKPASREERRRQRMSEDMDAHKALIDGMADAGLISEDARAENKALADAVATKFGNGPAKALQSPRKAAEAVSERTRTNPVANVEEEFADKGAASSHDPASRASEESERQRASMVGFADDCRTGGKEQSAAAAAPVGDAAAYAHGIPDTFSENDAVAAAATVLPSAERVTPHRSGSAAANAGGDHVDAHEVIAATAGAAVSAAPATRGTVTFEDFPPNPMRRAGFGHCFPELTAREYDALGTSIAFEGVLQPIVRRGNVILDGWARYNIARNLGIQYPVIEYDGDDELLDVIRWQRAARDFTPAQERKIAADLAKEVPHRASEIMAAFEIELEEA